MTDKNIEDVKDVDLQQKCDEYLNGWKRALADYENLKKDIGSEKERERNRLRESLAHDLLPVIDNFEQAVTHAPELEGSNKSWLDGVMFIKKQFEDVMQSLGLEKISVGDTFDPNTMEAVGEGEAMKEVSPGWKLGEKVIRPAKVIIKS